MKLNRGDKRKINREMKELGTLCKQEDDDNDGLRWINEETKRVEKERAKENMKFYKKRIGMTIQRWLDIPTFLSKEQLEELRLKKGWTEEQLKRWIQYRMELRKNGNLWERKML